MPGETALASWTGTCIHATARHDIMAKPVTALYICSLMGAVIICPKGSSSSYAYGSLRKGKASAQHQSA